MLGRCVLNVVGDDDEMILTMKTMKTMKMMNTMNTMTNDDDDNDNDNDNENEEKEGIPNKRTQLRSVPILKSGFFLESLDKRPQYWHVIHLH